MDVLRGRRLAQPDEPIVDQGLAFDLESVLINRRRVLRLMGQAGLAVGVAACAPAAVLSPSPTATSGSTATATATATAAAADCDVIPEETNGPFPADGTNGPNVLTESGIVRGDIRSSFGGSSGTAEGVPLTITLAIQDAGKDCAALAGAAVYVWHCDRDGRYSIYSQGVTDQNYLRGVQEAGGDGKVTFQSIFPACYTGRWPHVHFEVYPSLAKAIDAGNRLATSQIALPKASCDAVYATSGYEQSVGTLSRLSLNTDMVFRDDGAAHQLGTMGGTIEGGLSVQLSVPIGT
jgi:protocatechuate 3,4-dioxygenase beta subunit